MNVKPKPKHNKEPQPIAATSSPTCCKPNVGCCTSMKQLLCWCVINSYNVEGQDGTKQVVIDFEELVEQFDYFIEKEKEQIVDAFTAGQVDIGNVLIEHFNKKKWFFQANHTLPENDKEDGEEYFNKTFKN